ncbi:hypothetical protein [Planctomicrobium sp. SH527]|uniref:hypothetical protein n=1 Tax=Planctomicrobium sp. SH527 TaxID=3448123 RepID=UPI003F5C3953
MAKKKAARGDFNMSEEIRNLLKNDASLSSREVFEALGQQFPGQEINRNSCNVAFSHARRKLGIKGGGNRAVRRRRPSVSAAVSGGSLNLGTLQAARELLSQAGSAEAAVQAIEQLQALQLN